MGTRTHTLISTGIWANDTFRKLPAPTQALHFLLRTQTDLGHAGLIALRHRRWANFSDSWTPEGFRDAFHQLADAGFLAYDEATEEVLLTGFIAEDNTWKQPNVYKAAAAEARSIESPHLLAVLHHDLCALPVNQMTKLAYAVHEGLLTWLSSKLGLPNPLAKPSSKTPRKPSRKGSEDPSAEPSPMPLWDPSADPSGNPSPEPSANPPRTRARLPQPLPPPQPQPQNPAAADTDNTPPSDTGSARERATKPSDTDTPNPTPALARALVKAWWDGLDTKPLGAKKAWFSALAVVEGALKAGWSPAELHATLTGFQPPLSPPRLDFALRKTQEQAAANGTVRPSRTDTELRGGLRVLKEEFGLTDEQVLELWNPPASPEELERRRRQQELNAADDPVLLRALADSGIILSDEEKRALALLDAQRPALEPPNGEDA